MVSLHRSQVLLLQSPLLFGSNLPRFWASPRCHGFDMFWPTRFARLHSQGSVGSHAKVREERHANSSKRIRPCFGDRVGHDYWPSLRGGMEHTRIPNCWSNKGLILLEFVGFSYVLKKLLLYRCSLCGGVIMSFMCFHVCLLHSSPVLQYSIFGWILDPNRLLVFLSLRRLNLGINWYIYVPHSVIGW